MKKLLLILLLFSTCFLMYGQDTINLKEVDIISFYRADKKIPVTQKTAITENSYTEEVPIYLSKTPSITSNSDGGHNIGYSYMRLRGIDQTRINFTLDGIPLNEPEDQGFYSSNFPDFVASTSSTQIIRGVGPSNYGVSSYVGSVNFESKNLPDSAYLKLIRDFGSYNTNKRGFEINTGSLKNLALYYRISSMNTDGYKEHSGSDGYSSFFKIGYFKKNDIFKFSFFNGNVNNNLAWYGVTKKEIEDYGRRYNANTINEDDEYKETLAYLQYIHNINNKSDITTSVYYSKLDGYWAYDYGDIIKYNVRSNLYGLTTNYVFNKNNFKINVGINGSTYNRLHFGETNIKLYENKGIKNNLNTYSKLSYSKRNFTTYIDLQESFISYDYVKDIIDPISVGMNKKEWRFFNPKAGLSYNFNNNKIYLSVGKMQREPTRADMFGGLDNLDVNNINFTNISPEDVIDYEIGLNIDKKSLKYNLNYFYMDFNNEITLSGALGQNGLPLMSSVDRSFRSGFESDLDVLYKNFELNNNFTFMYNEIKTDSGNFKPVMTPDFLINTSLTYNYKKFELSMTHKYISKRYIDLENTSTLDPFQELGMNLKYKTKNFDISFITNNLTNEKNFSTAYLSYGEILYMVSAERNYYLSLIFKL